MRLLSRTAPWSVALALTLAVACSGAPPSDDGSDAAGGEAGAGSGGEGSGGESADDGSTGGSIASTGGGESTGSGGEASGGQPAEGGNGGFGGEGSGGGGTGGSGTGGAPGECTNGDTQPGTTACGLNGRGTLVQSCNAGVWIDTAVCTDGEECTDDDQQTLTDVCGMNDRGDIEQTCVAGFWSGSDCDDPDECIDDDQQTLTDVCGYNDRGDIEQVCVLGLWDGSSCDDPDECEDGDADTQPCLGGSGVQELSCIDGLWETGECELVLYRASVDSAGTQGNGASRNPVLSADGRYVAFQSTSSNLVVGDTNGAEDIFVHDVQTGETSRVSLGSISGQNSKFASISADGRYVAFDSEASDLVAGDTNGFVDVFVRDREAATTTRVSVTSLGAQVNGISEKPRISADGRYVVFVSTSSTLVPSDSNSSYDAFLHDRNTGSTTRLSTTIAGVEANSYTDQVAISGDGNVVGFYGAASNLIAGDNNAYEDVFVRDLVGNTLVFASVSSDEVQGNSWSQYPALSSDGRFVAFQSGADNLAPGDPNQIFDVFVRDTVLGVTEIVSLSEAEPQHAAAQNPSISGDGRFVAFGSRSDLLAGDGDDLYDFFVRDRQTGTLRRFEGSLTSPANTNARSHVSTDGHFFAFSSQATTLVDGDTNGVQDVFVAPLD